MNADSEKNKRTLLVLGYLGKFTFYGGFLATVAVTFLGSMSNVDAKISFIAVPIMVFGFAMAWGAGNNRAIVELQERLTALEECDRSS